MKKLILTAAVAIAAVATQAATVQWSSARLYTAASADGGFSTAGIGSAATAYLFTLSAAEYSGFLEAYNANGNMKSVWDAYKTSLASATGTKTGALTSAATIKTTADVDDTVYGAIIYTYTDTTLGKDFYIANIATGTVGADSGLTIGNLGTVFLGEGTASSTATGGWQAVPEPTSGLLLLLGVAGLALKRKRA